MAEPGAGASGAGLGSVEFEAGGGRRGRRRRRQWKAHVASTARWLHVYLSMLGLFVLLFFSVTGITLNHPSWFYGGAESTRQMEGALDPGWVRPRERGVEEGEEEADPVESVARLEVVEHLRAAHGLRGRLASFTADETECSVTFKGPGYSADAFIDRETGRYEVTESSLGLVAVINDLHKGRDSGPVWSVLIDVSAALLVVASGSGLVLLFYIKRRRMTGLAVAAVGTLVVLGLIRWFVP